MLREPSAFSSNSLVPMLPYNVEMDFPSGMKVRCSVISVCADKARSGVTNTIRRCVAKQRKMQSSATRVFPALVGRETTSPDISHY
jgi:hypothetical protein